MSDTMINPQTEMYDPTKDGNQAAHIVKKEDQMLGYVMGKEVTALCGLKFIPTQDYEGKPICQACLDELAQRRAQ